jgi:hypothetical protein
VQQSSFSAGWDFAQNPFQASSGMWLKYCGICGFHNITDRREAGIARDLGQFGALRYSQVESGNSWKRHVRFTMPLPAISQEHYDL